MKDYPALAPRIPLPAPLCVFLEFTNRCNFKCSFCPESLPDYAEKAGGYHVLSWELFQKICCDIRDMGGVKVLRFYGLGETLLHLHAVDAITAACSMGIAEETQMTTNGSMLTPDVSRKLIQSGLQTLHVSIYGTTREEMHHFTRSVIPPERIRENLVAFRQMRGLKMNPRVIAKIATDDPKAEARFRSMYTEAVDEVEVVPIHNWTGQDGLVSIGRKHTTQCCPSPFYQVKINADGIVTCCATDWRRDTDVGDVSKESLSAIWNGKRMREFRLMHLNHRRCENAACANCDFIDSFHDNLDGETIVL